MPVDNLLPLIAIPLISAATGYATNYIAVRMLFRPQEERRVGFFRIQGLIPRRRAQLAESIGETVEAHLISHEDIRRALADPKVDSRIHDMLDARVSRLLAERLPALHPMAGLFLTDDLLAKIKETIMADLLEAIPPMTEQILDTLEENLDFRRLVVEKVEGFDLDKFEGIVLQIASRELRAIEILGGVLGFAIGLMTDVLLALF